MNKEMIISSGDHETRVAILEDDQVVEVFIEREKQRGVVGNVYKGRVNKVLPGMQSSFIDIGLERDAFLYVSEVVSTVEEFERLAGDDEDEPGRLGRSRGTPPPKSERPLSSPRQRTESLAAEAVANRQSSGGRWSRCRRTTGPSVAAATATARRPAARADPRTTAIVPTPRSRTCSRKGRTSSSRSSRSRSAPRARA